MKIYRIEYKSESGRSYGFQFFTSMVYVKRMMAEESRQKRSAEFTEINIPITKGGILKLLKEWASHPDNEKTVFNH